MVEAIQFTAYFIVSGDGKPRMIDTDPATMLHDGEKSFGPYLIEIPMPKDVALDLEMRAKIIKGSVSEGGGDET